MMIIAHEVRACGRDTANQTFVYTFWADDGTILQEIEGDILLIGDINKGMCGVGTITTPPNTNMYCDAIDDYWADIDGEVNRAREDYRV